METHEPFDPSLAVTTVVVVGGDSPLADELAKACRLAGATTLLGHDLLSDWASVGDGPLVLLAVSSAARDGDRWRSEPVADREMTVFTVCGPGEPSTDTAGIPVRHGPLAPLWTDCRGERHEGGGPGVSSRRDAAEEIVRVVSETLAAPGSPSRAA